MRTYISFRVARFIRIGIPVNVGSSRPMHVPAWVGWLIVALIVYGVFAGYR